MKNKKEDLPRIKGHCKDCKFNKLLDSGMDTEALCINNCLNKFPYQHDTDDPISLNGDDYCSLFEPREEKK